ncbi:Intraflagellar transport protein 20 [Borealophlyctis nickersoniae]|nr:Intraflagellar transport protein 20 [Borealophlyctis nickersoniae]
MSTDANSNPPAIFDEFSKIRILDPSNFEASEKLKEECRDFTQRINDFNSIVQTFLVMMDEKARQIETEKLKAIGQRNRVESEMENRKSKRLQMQSLIKERQAELDRLTTQADSLLKMQQEQQALIESFSSK